MKVGTSEDDIDTPESVALRQGFATVLAVYRDITIDSYYGELQRLSTTRSPTALGLAPQSTDAGYEVAYSTDVDGNPIYTSDMTDDEKYDAALQAAIGFFKKAGFTWDDATASSLLLPKALS